jgi:hypothetical protein
MSRAGQMLEEPASCLQLLDGEATKKPRPERSRSGARKTHKDTDN